MLSISCTVTAVGFTLLPCLMLQYSRCLGVLGLFLDEDWVTFPRFIAKFFWSSNKYSNLDRGVKPVICKIELCEAKMALMG